jgi:putative Mg2+ transporter-C (MgtC) family protein
MAPLISLEAQLSVVLTVLVAMILGGFVGVTRELQHKPAGLRTHMLVAGAAALLTGVARVLIADYGARLATGLVRGDPVGVIQAIIVGISFLGAGTIVRDPEGERVQGLTTAASLLMVAAIGISSALSLWLVAVAATVFAVITLRGLRWLDQLINRNAE